MRLNKLFSGTAIALALVLSACGGGGSGGDDTLTLRRGISAKVDTLDPHRSSAAWENIIIGDMFHGLMQHAPDGEVIPAMADSWETSEDGLNWTFTLRETTWSDGVPVTAGDFVYGLRRIQDPAIASQYSSLLYIIKNAQALNEARVAPEELGVRAIDDLTLEITLEEPAPYFLGLLTHYTTFPVPQHIVEQFGESWVQPDNIEVNGPYKLVYWVTGDQIVAEKNPLFYEADTLCFERVSYFELEDLAAVERRIEAGDLDINNDFDGGRKAELDRRFPGWARTTPGLLTTYWSFNSSEAPFDDVRVRKALAMAIDREFLVESVLTPGFIPAYNFVPPGIANYETDRPEVDWANIGRRERLMESRRLLNTSTARRATIPRRHPSHKRIGTRSRPGSMPRSCARTRKFCMPICAKAILRSRMVAGWRTITTRLTISTCWTRMPVSKTMATIPTRNMTACLSWRARSAIWSSVPRSLLRRNKSCWKTIPSRPCGSR